MNRPASPVQHSAISVALAAILAFLPARGAAAPAVTTKQQALDALSGFLDYIVVVSGGKSTRPGGAMTRQQVADALSGVVSYLSSGADAPAGGGASAPAKLTVEQASDIIKAAFAKEELKYDLSFRNGKTPHFQLLWSPQEEWSGAIKHYKVDLVVDEGSIWARTSAVGVDTSPALSKAAELAFRLDKHFPWGFVAIDFDDGELYYDYRMPMEEFSSLGERAPLIAMNVSRLTLQRVAPYFVRLLRGGESPKELDEQFQRDRAKDSE